MPYCIDMFTDFMIVIIGRIDVLVLSECLICNCVYAVKCGLCASSSWHFCISYSLRLILSNIQLNNIQY